MLLTCLLWNTTNHNRSIYTVATLIVWGNRNSLFWNKIFFEALLVYLAYNVHICFNNETIVDNIVFKMSEKIELSDWRKQKWKHLKMNFEWITVCLNSNIRYSCTILCLMQWWIVNNIVLWFSYSTSWVITVKKPRKR